MQYPSESKIAVIFYKPYMKSEIHLLTINKRISAINLIIDKEEAKNSIPLH